MFFAIWVVFAAILVVLVPILVVFVAIWEGKETPLKVKSFFVKTAKSVPSSSERRGSLSFVFMTIVELVPWAANTRLSLSVKGVKICVDLAPF